MDDTNEELWAKVQQRRANGFDYPYKTSQLFSMVGDIDDGRERILFYIIGRKFAQNQNTWAKALAIAQDWIEATGTTWNDDYESGFENGWKSDYPPKALEDFAREIVALPLE